MKGLFMAENEIIKINSEKLNRMQVLGRGACSVAYKYGDNQVVKVLNESGMKLHNEEQFEQLLRINNDICAFPQIELKLMENFKDIQWNMLMDNNYKKKWKN